MAKQAVEIIPAKISYIGERFELPAQGQRPDLPVRLILYVTAPTYECKCGAWCRQSMLRTFSRDHHPLCPVCYRPMQMSKRTLRPLIRGWAERLDNEDESFAQ